MKEEEIKKLLGTLNELCFSIGLLFIHIFLGGGILYLSYNWFLIEPFDLPIIKFSSFCWTYVILKILLGKMADKKPTPEESFIHDVRNVIKFGVLFLLIFLIHLFV